MRYLPFFQLSHLINCIPHPGYSFYGYTLCVATSLSLPPGIAPCKTLNRAFGYHPCGTCTSTGSLSDVIFELSTGVHHLNGCIGIVEATNITIQSQNIDEDVTIECESFPNDIVGNYDNIYVCGSSDVTFRGIQFTRCGPQSPNVFLNSSSGLLFDNCTFMYVHA